MPKFSSVIQLPPIHLKRIWEIELGRELQDDSWWALFPNFLKLVKPTKLRAFQYRILTRSLTTNTKRHKWNRDVSEKCTFCRDAPETMDHLLFQCKLVSDLWLNLSKILNYYYKVQITFNRELVFFNNYNAQHKHIVNLTVIALKQYLYATKCFEKPPSFAEYMLKLNYWFTIDKQYALDNKSMKQLYKKWKNLF